MIGVDTNLLARFLLKDDPAQHRRAVSALASGEELCFPITVLLELAWVLGARKATQTEIVASLRSIVALPHARPRYPEAIRRALDWAEKGMGIADALHLAQCDKAEGFLTFDDALTRRARKLAAKPAIMAP